MELFLRGAGSVSRPVFFPLFSPPCRRGNLFLVPALLLLLLFAAGGVVGGGARSVSVALSSQYPGRRRAGEKGSAFCVLWMRESRRWLARFDYGAPAKGALFFSASLAICFLPSWSFPAARWPDLLLLGIHLWAGHFRLFSALSLLRPGALPALVWRLLLFGATRRVFLKWTLRSRDFGPPLSFAMACLTAARSSFACFSPPPLYLPPWFFISPIAALRIAFTRGAFFASFPPPDLCEHFKPARCAE